MNTSINEDLTDIRPATRALKQISMTRLTGGKGHYEGTHHCALLMLDPDCVEMPMDDRHGHASTIVISQLPTDQWYANIGDNTLADAILDRLMHNAHRLQLTGESMRKKLAELTDGEHLG